MEGSVLRVKDRVRISAKLIQTNIEGSLWSDSFERQYPDVLALQSDVATAIARGISVQLTSEEQTELARNRSVVPEAYEDYLKGRFESAKRTQEGFLAAEDYFKKAIDQDPTFAGAYAGLAEVYLNMGSYQMRPAKDTVPLAKVNVAKALKLDDRLAEAILFWPQSVFTIWSCRGSRVNFSGPLRSTRDLRKGCTGTAYTLRLWAGKNEAKRR